MKHTVGHTPSASPHPAMSFGKAMTMDQPIRDDFIFSSDGSFPAGGSTMAASVPDPLDRVYEAHLIEHKRLFEVMLLMRHDIETTSQMLARCLAGGNKIILCGDGVSQADAHRFAAGLSGCLMNAMAHRAEESVVALDVRPGVNQEADLTLALAGQVDKVGTRGDCLIAISASGDEEATVMAIKAARKRGIATIALSGEDGRINRICDQVMAVPAASKARVQEAHLFIVHALCALVEARLNAC